MESQILKLKSSVNYIGPFITPVPPGRWTIKFSSLMVSRRGTPAQPLLHQQKLILCYITADGFYPRTKQGSVNFWLCLEGELQKNLVIKQIEQLHPHLTPTKLLSFIFMTKRRTSSQLFISHVRPVAHNYQPMSSLKVNTHSSMDQFDGNFSEIELSF